MHIRRWLLVRQSDQHLLVAGVPRRPQRMLQTTARSSPGREALAHACLQKRSSLPCKGRDATDMGPLFLQQMAGHLIDSRYQNWELNKIQLIANGPLGSCVHDAVQSAPVQVQSGAWNHFVQSFGRHADWASFADVDEFFEPNATYADALESGAMTLADVLEEVTAMPVCIRLER